MIYLYSELGPETTLTLGILGEGLEFGVSNTNNQGLAAHRQTVDSRLPHLCQHGETQCTLSKCENNKKCDRSKSPDIPHSRSSSHRDCDKFELWANRNLIKFNE